MYSYIYTQEKQMLQTATAVSNFTIFSHILKYINKISNNYKMSREINNTCKELNKLSDSELRDIGIRRDDIRSIAMEPYYNNIKAR
jgi:uncharacterized protein YjiS (DUF1127 family)